MLNVYLSGEIHTSWRNEIIQLCEKEKLDINFSSPNTDHESSDNCGIEILGDEESNYWKDNKGARINSIRTKKAIKDSDVVIVKFGEKYKQWNAAFDAGYASALNKSIIVIHNDDHQHALKEVDASASAVAKDQPRAQGSHGGQSLELEFAQSSGYFRLHHGAIAGHDL